MRLLKLDIDKSIQIKLDKSIQKDNAKGIMTYGGYNDYPEIIERIVNNSVTGKSSARIYAKFLTGDGFIDEQLNNIIVSKDFRGKKITLRSLLSQAANSISYFNGVYFHCNISLNREIGSVKLVPFKHCRFEKLDDTGYTSKIAVYDNWQKDSDKKYDKEKVIFYNVFNLEEKVFAEQIREIGGIDKFKGQIYFHFFDNQYIYPLSSFDDVYMDCDTEYQISLYKNRCIRNGMFDKTVFRVEAPSNDIEKRELKEGIRSFIGPDGDSVLILEDEFDPETGQIKESGSFKIDKIESNVNPRLFENWEKGLANNIRKALSDIPAILIDYEESKLGTTSGEAIQQAVNFYNQMTQDDRTQLSEIFKEIFSNSVNETLKNANFEIKKLNLYDGTTSNI
jgi:hypothetical protein